MARDDYAEIVSRYYGRGDLADRVMDAIKSAGINPETATALQLAPFDNLHPGGRNATLDLAKQAGFAPGARVIDIGGGVGGPARTLASEFGWTVTVLDLTEEFCQVGTMLTELTKMSDRVSFRQGNALDAPFPDGSFDAVWMQYSGMNIPDKARLYSEIHRLLRPGGRYALQESMSGTVGPLYYPVPWARDPAGSFLQTVEGARTLLEGAGFSVLVWDDVSGPALAAQRERATAATTGPGPSVVSGPEIVEAFKNMVPNMEEDRVRVIQAVMERAT